MLLKLLKSKQPASLVVIILLSLFFWFNPFHQVSAPNLPLGSSMPLYSILIKFIPLGTTVSKCISLILILTISLLITRLNTKFIFISNRSYLLTIIFLIIVLGLSHITDLSPILPATIFLLFSIEKLLGTYKSENLTYKIFDASLLAAISSLFYFNYFFFILYIWSNLLIIRSFYIREWIYSILGYAVCYFIVFSIYYLFSLNQQEIIDAIKYNFTTLNKISFSHEQMILLIITSLFILISSHYILNKMGSKKIFTRKTYNLFFILFLNSLLIMFFIKSANNELLIASALPTSALIGHFILETKESKWIKIILAIFLLSFILTQFNIL